MNSTRNVSDIAYGNPKTKSNNWDKTFIEDMIFKFGKKETINRWSWHLNLDFSETENLLNSYLNDNWVDEEGVKGGQKFYGDL